MSAAFLEWLTTPLFIWYVVQIVCIITLMVEAVILLTLWRRPSRSWWLGLVSIPTASAVVWLALFGSTSFDLQIINECYCRQSCYAYSTHPELPPIAVAKVVLQLMLAIACVCGCVVLARRFRARDQRPPLSSALFTIARVALMAVGVVASTVGLFLAVVGLLSLYHYYFYFDPSNDFESVGLAVGNIATIAGAVGVGVGALVLWLTGRRSRTRIA